MCCSHIYDVRGFHVYKSVFLGWVVGRFNIAVNGEHKYSFEVKLGLDLDITPGGISVYIRRQGICFFSLKIDHLFYV